MSEMMTGMAAGVVPRDKERPSYLGSLEHDGSPESYPEVAREMTMLRGAASSVDMKLNEAFEEFSLLERLLQPIVDQSPTPARDVPLLRESSDHSPMLTTGVGADIRHTANHLGSLEAQLDTLSGRLRTLRGRVRL